MKQKISEFLFDISQTFPVRSGLNAEKVLEDTRTYLIGKCYKKEFDFDRAKSLLFDDYKQKTFPLPKEILAYLMQSEVKNYTRSEDEGCLVVATLPNGVMYSFEIAPFGRSAEEIKKQMVSNYGNVQIKTYPKGSVLIGKEVITP